MIPVFEPVIGDAEVNAVVEALRKGEISGTYGETIPEFERKFAAYCETGFGVAVTSGTTALQLAAAAAGITRGDEVLVSASTNIATALAAYHNGATAVPVDAETESWNLDLDLIESLITPRTKAIIPVHLFGHPVDMDRLRAIADKHHLIVIEDSAEAHGAECRGRKTGSFGEMACFSFYSNKIITTGEGGMVVTNNPKLAEKLRYLRNLAFGKPRFLHQSAGYNFRMTGYQAAMGLAQLGKIESIIAAKRKLAGLYHEYLGGVEELRLPAEASWAKHVYWMYGLVVRDKAKFKRDDLLEDLFRNGIETRTFFCPMNRQPFLQAQEGHRQVPCPVADSLWRNGFYLPSSVNLGAKEVELIAGRIKSFISGK